MELSGMGMVNGINKWVLYFLYYEKVCYQITVLGIRLEKKRVFFPYIVTCGTLLTRHYDSQKCKLGQWVGVIKQIHRTRLHHYHHNISQWDRMQVPSCWKLWMDTKGMYICVLFLYSFHTMKSY